MARQAIPVDQIREEGLACECANQQPARRLVDYGATQLSLLFCASCGGKIVDVRPHDELAVMRQDVDALKRIAADLYEQLGPQRDGPAGRGARPASRAPLRVLPGGRESRRPG